MIVYVVWDPLYERVMSVHKTDEGAQNKKYGSEIDKEVSERDSYYLEIVTFELEE